MGKKKHVAKDAKEWRQFERLVARVHQAFVNKGAIIKSPDRIPELITGDLRDVDVSIRYTESTVSVLITIECRKREQAQDKMWIEQLIAKRSIIGASKTIAVSSKRFTKGAIRTAKYTGIELRTISEIDDEEISTWAAMKVVNSFSLSLTITKAVILFADHPDLKGIDFSNFGKLQLQTIRVWDPSHKHSFSIFDMVQASFGKLNLWINPNDGQEFEKKFHINLEKNYFFADTPIGRYAVERINVAVAVRRKIQVIPVLRKFRYQSGEQVIVEGIEFAGDFVEGPGLLSIYKTFEDPSQGITVTRSDAEGAN